MYQNIRNCTFETNSSSTHSLALLKIDKEIEFNNPRFLISIIQNDQYLPKYSKDPEILLSYIYTIALVKHRWDIINNIKQEFPNCIFQKPQWDLPFDNGTGYCDDKEIISFCELSGSDVHCYFDDTELDILNNHLREFIFKGELHSAWDGGFESCVKNYHHIEEDKITEWIKNNVIYLLGDN